MNTFFLDRLNSEPHALAFAGQSTPWPVALADQSANPALDEALHTHAAAAQALLYPVSAELLAFGPHCSQAALEKHLRDQKRNEREVREYLEERVRPYELRLEDGARPSDAVGMIDLTIKATPSQKLVSLPKDRMFRSEQASKASRKKVTDDTFLNAKGDKALSLLRAMNE